MSRRPRQNHAAALTARVALAAHQRRSNGGSWRSNRRAANEITSWQTQLDWA